MKHLVYLPKLLHKTQEIRISFKNYNTNVSPNYFLQHKKRLYLQILCVNQWMTQMIGDWSLKPSAEKLAIAKSREKFSRYSTLH